MNEGDLIDLLFLICWGYCFFSVIRISNCLYSFTSILFVSDQAGQSFRFLGAKVFTGSSRTSKASLENNLHTSILFWVVLFPKALFVLNPTPYCPRNETTDPTERRMRIKKKSDKRETDKKGNSTPLPRESA